MLNILAPLRGLLRTPSFSIDNIFFRLHYKLTTAILLAFAVLITPGQLLRNPMDCHFAADDREKFLNTYCYVHSTFLEEPSVTGQRSPHISGVSGQGEERKMKYYKYYQWVLFSLIFQGIFFYIPHYIWKIWEGGKMRMLTTELSPPAISEECRETNIEQLVNYFCRTLHTHNSYIFKYFMCEILNLANILGQIAFMNAFLGKDFASLGISIIMSRLQPKEGTANNIDRLFPTITKCSYNNYSHSGTLETTQGTCVLPQNLTNAKIYIFLWFWCHVLAVISTFVIVYRIAILCSPSLRLYRFRSFSHENSARHINIVFLKLNIGDWFLLQMLQRNLSSISYQELIAHIAHNFDSRIVDVPTISHV